MESLTIRSLSVGTVYKLLFLGSLIGFIPVGLFFGIFGFLGLGTVTWNDQPITGPAALYAGPLIGVFISGLFTAIYGTVTVLGLWILSLFKPIQILYHESTEPGASE